MEMHWYPEGQMNNCITTRYIDNLNWYLVVQKNTRPIRESFRELMRRDVLIIAVMLVLLLSLSAR